MPRLYGSSLNLRSIMFPRTTQILIPCFLYLTAPRRSIDAIITYNYLLSTKRFEWGMKLANWSFLEAGHGKGAADGIGGVLKRIADRLVAEGNAIADVQSLFDALHKNTNVRLCYITEEAASCIDNLRRKPTRRQLVEQQTVKYSHHRDSHRDRSRHWSDKLFISWMSLLTEKGGRLT